METSKNLLHFKVFIGFLAALLIGIGIFIGIQETILQKGEILFLESAPVDPRDLLRGDYVILRYLFEREEEIQKYIQENNITRGTQLYVSFERDDSNLGRFKNISQQLPDEGLFLRVTANGGSGGQSQIDTHIGKYFVSEGTGREIERIRSDMTIKLRVNSNGVARIIDLYYQGDRIIPSEFRLN